MAYNNYPSRTENLLAYYLNHRAEMMPVGASDEAIERLQREADANNTPEMLALCARL